jgi:hypothetical protein
MSIFASKKSRSPIRRAKLLGMRTAQETLIFSTVNFTIYSFWVEYENGFSETVEISPQNPNDKSGKEKKLFHELMSYVNKEDSKTSGINMSGSASSDILDELKKLKDLFDMGVVPDNIYEKKRAVLLERLSSACEVTSDVAEYNVIIVRGNRQARGEADTQVYVDGDKLNTSIDDSVPLKLSRGKHVLYFRRAAIKSQKLELTVQESKKYKVTITPKTFSIEAGVEEM